MKHLKLIFFIVVVLSCSYASMWFGFYKGFEYSQSTRMVEAESKRSVLVSLRQGKTEDAMVNLELQMYGDILSAYYSQSGFEKYILGAEVLPTDGKKIFSNRIFQYMEQYPYKCHPDKETCEAIQSAVKKMAEMPPNKSLKDAP